MLALSRKIGQNIVIDDNIIVTVVAIKGDQVRLAVSAPSDKKIYRGELYEAIIKENEIAAQPLNIKELDSLLKQENFTREKK